MPIIKQFVASLLACVLALFAVTPLYAQNPPSNQSFVGGRFVARNYNYTPIRISGGGGAVSTTYAIMLSTGSVALKDGRTIVPFSAGGLNILGQPGAYPAI